MTTKRRTPILTEYEAREKRDRLARDGYCVVPGVLRGALLNRLRDYSDRFLDEHAVASAVRYQGSDFHIRTERAWKEREGKIWTQYHDPIADAIIDHPVQAEACALCGLEGMKSDETFIILDKPPGGPALYWHQDNMDWNHPKSALPWPHRVFLSYYLVDTTRENGCLRAIPGSHLHRLPIHDLLPAAHGPEIQTVDESHPSFMEHPDEVDIAVKAGDLVIADNRVLHAAWANRSNRRRTLILQWWSCFPYPSVPSWWDGGVPADLLRAVPPDAMFDKTRIPGNYLATA